MKCNNQYRVYDKHTISFPDFYMPFNMSVSGQKNFYDIILSSINSNEKTMFFRRSLRQGQNIFKKFTIKKNKIWWKNCASCGIVWRVEFVIWMHGVLIIWNQASMSHKAPVETLDQTMRDLRDKTAQWVTATFVIRVFLYSIKNTNYINWLQNMWNCFYTIIHRITYIIAISVHTAPTSNNISISDDYWKSTRWNFKSYWN